MPSSPSTARASTHSGKHRSEKLNSNGIHIVTDSTASFPEPAIADRPNVTILPLTIHVGTRSFLDRNGATTQQIRGELECRGTLPVVASPSVEAFVSTFDCLCRKSPNILCLLTSHRLCRAVRNARHAAEQFTGRYQISVVDSLTTSSGLGMLIHEALRIADRGATLDDVVRQLRYAIPRMYAVFYVEDLAYLQRIGRINRSQVLLGEMLGVKPFLSLEEGGIVPLEKVRTQEQAVEQLMEFISEFSQLRHLSVVYDMHEPQPLIRVLLERIRDEFPDCPLSTGELGASVASIFGPRSTGLIVYDMSIGHAD